MRVGAGPGRHCEERGIPNRHCEERSDVAIWGRLLHCVRNDEGTERNDRMAVRNDEGWNAMTLVLRSLFPSRHFQNP